MGITAVGTVGELGERAVIERIRARLAPAPPWVAVGVGDDAAVLRPERNRVEVVTADSLVEGVHFDRAYVPPASIGHKALAVNLSDLAAMGAEPRAALLSLVLPPALPVEDLDAIVGGLLALAATHGVALVGGNVARSPGPLVIDVTATGVVKPRKVLLRSGARPGDDLYVSGQVGAAAAGLRLCRAGDNSWRPASAGRDAGDHDPGEDGVAACVRRFLEPEPRVRLGQLLAKSGVVTACMDLSDGLADAVEQVASASRAGAIVEGTAIPVPAAARRILAGQGSDSAWREDSWLHAAITGGEDYELLFTSPPRRRRALLAALQHARGVACTKIGRMTRDRRLVLRRAAGEDEALPAGFAHFR
jgi:thiamine-monophosphate kinase